MAGVKFVVAGVFATLILAGGAFFLIPVDRAEQAEYEQSFKNIEPAATDSTDSQEAREQEQGNSPLVLATADIVAPTELSQDELNSALRERVLGNPNAKLTIREHSSFTCGHCGAFHQKSFKLLKEQYLDTGKAKLVFSDFPLNASALEASMVARCLDEDRYFDFVQLLFSSQEQWAYSPNYRTFLRQNAQLAGLSAEKFETCSKSEALRTGILDQMQETQKNHNITSTPSFVINGEETISGAQDFESFKKNLDKKLKALD